ncbi:DUF11 domain-containing protein, partial [Halocynthiibacter sp.]|uniref:DUF11 domain-containing protein n=1 Tax=Halocynthiibacter sp. TaxID=1979210 RepID=UPI003C4D77F1
MASVITMRLSAFIFLIALAFSTPSHAQGIVFSGSASGGVASGTFDIDGDSVGDGTWSFTPLPNSQHTSISPPIFIPNGISYRFDRTGPGSSSWDLRAVFEAQATGVAGFTYALTVNGNSQYQPYGSVASKFNSYELFWDSAAGAGTVVNPDNELRNSSIVLNPGYTRFEQRSKGDSVSSCNLSNGAIKNRCLEWFATVPQGTTSVRFHANDGGRLEAFSFSLRSEIDLTMEKTVSAPVMLPGEAGYYDIVIENIGAPGQSSALGLKLTELLPAGVTFTSASPSQGSYNNTTGLWEIGGLQRGDTASLRLHFTVDADTSGTITDPLAPGALVINQTDTQPNNNGNLNPVFVVPVIETSKTDTIDDTNGNGVTDAGDTINYDIVVSNPTDADFTNLAIISDTFERVDGTALSLTSAPTFSSATNGSTASLLKGGSTATFTASYVITQDDILAGGVRNTATAQITRGTATVTDISDDPDDDTNTDTEGDGEGDDLTVTTLTANPAVSVVKTEDYNDGGDGI